MNSTLPPADLDALDAHSATSMDHGMPSDEYKGGHRMPSEEYKGDHDSAAIAPEGGYSAAIAPEGGYSAAIAPEGGYSAAIAPEGGYSAAIAPEGGYPYAYTIDAAEEDPITVEAAGAMTGRYRGSSQPAVGSGGGLPKRYSGAGAAAWHGTTPLNYHTVVRKHGPVNYFSTRYAPGSRIRHAVSGAVELARVGSADEDAFFKVCMSTCELNDQTGSKQHAHHGKFLYYDSPEQYERHFKVQLSPDVVMRWHNKQHAAQ